MSEPIVRIVNVRNWLGFLRVYCSEDGSGVSLSFNAADRESGGRIREYLERALRDYIIHREYRGGGEYEFDTRIPDLAALDELLRQRGFRVSPAKARSLILCSA
ncbi:MAG: hypothetical protein A3A16_03480 [Candidatus Harrisonbacteria bacterium RIFCSPLOWO2_01_FULL_44_18]|uniref:Uncharacterized protein n=1 Tax=Candidatus Harrisonbacteria bacterium RIFCSPLOWO2_01_FULL_44_18 TaxID=1798407 RepID=A0A1G1ZLZ6_9BACT|nr:MAG: hypothetical protein A3A16_03480 [Candidatus Harrisonbacteria bacterium RIFCSPLOWO2_01_FULL_44_18]